MVTQLLVLDTAFKAQVEDLRRHMEEEGEICCSSKHSVSASMDEAPLEPVGELSLKASLTHKPGDAFFWLVSSSEDWIHDALDDVEISFGTIYATDEPFLPGAPSRTGYFQSDETGQWVYVADGKVAADADGACPWRDELTDFPELVDQFREAMDDPEYRHMAEKAVMRYYA